VVAQLSQSGNTASHSFTLITCEGDETQLAAFNVANIRPIEKIIFINSVRDWIYLPGVKRSKLLRWGRVGVQSCQWAIIGVLI